METLLSQVPSVPSAGEFYADLALGAVGVAVLVVAGLRLRRRPDLALLTSAPARPNHLRPEYILIPMAVFLACSLLGSAVVEGLSPGLPTEQAGSILAGSAAQLIGGIACVVLAGWTFKHGASAFLVGDRRVLRQAAVGAVAMIAVFPLCWGLYLLSTLVLSRIAPDLPLPPHDVLQILAEPDLPGWLHAALWLSAVVVAPLAEEAFFRGICQTALRQVLRPPIVPVVIVSAFFALSHGQPQAVASLFALSVALGYAYERTGSLVAPVILHLLFNLKNMIFFSIACAAG